jgi:hypothetical protein
MIVQISLTVNKYYYIAIIRMDSEVADFRGDSARGVGFVRGMPCESVEWNKEMTKTCPL